MGCNQSLWKLFGIIVGKHSKPKISCAHSCDSNQKLFFMPDAPYLLKNLRNHLTQGQVVIPADLAKKLNLLGRTVSVEPIKRVVERER